MAKKVEYTPNDGFLFDETETKEPEVCLGRTFASSDERREYYRNELRKYLKDPDFRAIEGFPIGDDEDIIALSDPPFYCACPNPWISQFINEWESQKPITNIPYKREPFAADISEGKKDPVYNAHTYHTKVPPRVIARYILHYTNPGDIVFDGFCGTGMTGVGAQFCNNRKILEDMGFRIEADSSFSLGTSKNTNYQKGLRHVVMNDLSPIASFIAYNLNSKMEAIEFEKKANQVLKEVENEYSWVYETTASNGSIGTINYTVWSDVFICPHCGEEIVFYEQAADKKTGKVSDSFLCPHCGISLTKKEVKRVFTTEFDPILGQTVTIAKQEPVLINYTYNNKKYDKKPDSKDFELINKINEISIPYWIPNEKLIDGKETNRNIPIGITHVHQFYTKRTLLLLSSMLSKIKDARLKFWFTSQIINVSKLNRYRPGVSFPYNPLSGTLYIGSLVSESSVFIAYENKLKKIRDVCFLDKGNLIGVHSSTKELIPSNSIDYIFIDPPFGANINYSELSFIWEAWLKVKTNNKEEAIENESQGKGIFEYRELMKACFSETFRILKPGHWMTVEFSNTDSAVWNAIQTSLSEVGFIVANVSALDKQQGSFKAVTTSTAVKQDLIISLYKPDETFDKQITSAVGTEAVWTFVRRHLEYLPLTKKQGEATVTVPERDARIIYDRMLSYFVGHNMLIPISSPDFLAEMPTRFVERDGLYYLPEQAQKYDKMAFNSQIESIKESSALFVCDENSAIAWIRGLLKDKPMTIGEMTPLFMQELSNSWTKGEKKPELRDLLEENFLCYDGKYDVPSQIHSFLSTNYKDLRNLTKDNQALKDKAKGRWYIPDPNKASDLEKIREKALLKEFSLYENSKGKIKEFRIEAIRAGFKKAWQDKNYTLIKDIAERMPSNIVEEDEKLLMWYSGALNRLGE